MSAGRKSDADGGQGLYPILLRGADRGGDTLPDVRGGVHAAGREEGQRAGTRTQSAAGRAPGAGGRGGKQGERMRLSKYIAICAAIGADPAELLVRAMTPEEKRKAPRRGRGVSGAGGHPSARRGSRGMFHKSLRAKSKRMPLVRYDRIHKTDTLQEKPPQLLRLELELS